MVALNNSEPRQLGFVELPVTNMDGAAELVLIAIDDIGLVKERNGQTGCLVERLSNAKYPVWTTATYEEIYQTLRHAGAPITE